MTDAPKKSMLQMLQEAKLKKEQAAAELAVQVGRANDLIHGSGLTKQMATAAQAHANKLNSTSPTVRGNSLLGMLKDAANKRAGISPAAQALEGTEIIGPQIVDLSSRVKDISSKALTVIADAADDADIAIGNAAGEGMIDRAPADKQSTALVAIPPDGLTLDESQEAALKGMEHQQVCVLIGPAGCGKTTVTKRLVTQLQRTTPTINVAKMRADWEEGTPPEYNVAIAFMSFTGRAVQQLKRALPVQYHPMCATAHSHLGFAPVFYEVEEPMDNGLTGIRTKMRFEPTFGVNRKLAYRVVVIDEAGMMPVVLFNQLIDALLPDCRIILIGDINQLPPVQGRSVLGFAMTQWPTFELTKIHRQAEGDPIITGAHAILKGLYPKKVPQKFDQLLLPDSQIQAGNKFVATIKALHNAGQLDPVHDAIIVPQNKGEIGQWILNEKLINYFNPQREIDGVVINRRTQIQAGYQTVAYAIGDKVMLTANERTAKGILTNGMTGFITEVNMNGAFDPRKQSQVSFDMHDPDAELEELDLNDLVSSAGFNRDGKPEADDENQRQASHIVHVQFTDGQSKAFITAGDYRNLTHAYVFTCHKSQGGEYRNVIIFAHSSNNNMLCREWLYTAVTRAKQRVIICHNDRGLAQSLAMQRVKGRTIQEKAESFIKRLDKKDTSLPVLWPPRVLMSQAEYERLARENA